MQDMSVTASTFTAPADLPRWNLSVLFPDLESVEFEQGFDTLIHEVGELSQLFDENGVTSGETVEFNASLVLRFERVLQALNAVEERSHSLASYLHGHVTTNSRNELAQQRYSELQIQSVLLDTLATRFNAWIGRLPLKELVERSAMASDHAYPLRLLHASAKHLMSDREESLAAELGPSAGGAWAKLHTNLTSQIAVPVEVEGETRSMSMSQVRNLALESNRDLRRRAWEAELSAWEAHALPIAAALNGVKGQAITLDARRGWLNSLDEALFWSGIDRQILETFIAEARRSFPDFRRYMRLKAKALGISDLAWYDLFAPIGNASRVWSWSEAARFLEAQFGVFSERMAGLAHRAFSEEWFDAGPRPGKVGGAYCMWLTGDQSRILANYSPTYDGVSTLAHELGHAYHNLNQTGLTHLQRQNPMTLAETASTFCETLVKEAALAEADGAERLYIIEQSLQGACQIVVDIVSRFDFESALFAARSKRELSVSELRQMMLDAQEETYGDGLDDEARHPYMWAVKGHYYRVEQPYYNFPYLFGQLFGLGLFSKFREDPEWFPARYDALLRTTGLASAAELGEAFGIDLRSPEFWRSSLDLIRDDIGRFEGLLRA